MTRKNIGRRVLAQATQFAMRCQRRSTVRPLYPRRNRMKQTAMILGIDTIKRDDRSTQDQTDQTRRCGQVETGLT